MRHSGPCSMLPLCLALTITACSGGESDSDTATDSTASTTEATSTTAANQQPATAEDYPADGVGKPGQVITHPDGRRTITTLDGTVVDLDNATPGMHEHLKKKNPPGFDPTKAEWPPKAKPLPEGGPVPIVIHVDAVHKHGLHTTLDLRYTGPLDEVGDFSYSISLIDPNKLTLSDQRVMVPDGLTEHSITLMGVPADRVVGFKADLWGVHDADGEFLTDYADRYKAVIQDER